MHRDQRWIKCLHESSSVLRMTESCFVTWEEVVDELALWSGSRRGSRDLGRADLD